MAKELNLKASDTLSTLKDSVVAPDGSVVATAEFPKVPKPAIQDEVQRRQLAQHLSNLYFMQSRIVSEITSRHQKGTDLAGIASLLVTFYNACDREYQNKVDFKARGYAGYGHELEVGDVIAVARAIIMIFGPELMLDPEKKKVFADTLKSSAQDVMDTLES